MAAAFDSSSPYFALGQVRVDFLPPGLGASGASHPLIQPQEPQPMVLGLTPARQVPFVRQLGLDQHHHSG